MSQGTGKKALTSDCLECPGARKGGMWLVVLCLRSLQSVLLPPVIQMDFI